MNLPVEEKDREARTTMNGKPVFVVEAKSIINTKSGFEKKLLCDGLTFSMGDACAYRCAFCYVPAMFTKLPRVMALKAEHKLAHDEMVIRRGGALEILRAELVHPSGKVKYPDPADQRVIYSSPAVDVAANMDLVRETVEACKLILTHTHWNIRLLSKSHLLHKVAEAIGDWARQVKEADGYAEEWRAPGFHGRAKNRMIFGVSTGTLDDGVAAAFEQDTPKVSARLKSLHWLQDHGHRTFGMICPSLPSPDSVAYEAFSRDAMAAIRVEKCEHVWAEVINVRGESMTNTITALRNAGHQLLANRLHSVSTSTDLWEAYNRHTFIAHRDALAKHPGKLRYLTYVTKLSSAWWHNHVSEGVVLL